ncbi:MAG: hypothetical protein KJO07_12230 [Deltaproteobacteria bacterium]|nr:hypothetical protein [Deltaproteobacteria bacterium]
MQPSQQPVATPQPTEQRPPTRWTTLRCRQSQSFNYETAVIAWGERVSIELGAGTNLFLNGKLEWGNPSPRLRVLSANLAPTACEKRGDRQREMLCRVTGDDDSVISVGESADRMQRANIASARLFVGTQGEGSEERIEIQAEAAGTGGELAHATIRFGPGDCTRE